MTPSPSQEATLAAPSVRAVRWSEVEPPERKPTHMAGRLRYSLHLPQAPNYGTDFVASNRPVYAGREASLGARAKRVDAKCHAPGAPATAGTGRSSARERTRPLVAPSADASAPSWAPPVAPELLGRPGRVVRAAGARVAARRPASSMRP